MPSEPAISMSQVAQAAKSVQSMLDEEDNEIRTHQNQKFIIMLVVNRYYLVTKLQINIDKK